MQIHEFTEDALVCSIIDELQNNKVHERVYSDCIDSQGAQYVDLVLEGGGVLGVALVGYTWLLEKMGIRFASLAGTSAGAINAMLLAAHHSEQPQLASEWVLDRIANTQFDQFMDGGKHARKFIFKLLEKRGWLSLGISYLRLKKKIARDLGIHPGTYFTSWLSEALDEMSINTVADLKAHLQHKSKFIKYREESVKSSATPSLAIKVIAAELSTQSKIELPEMAELFWLEPEQVNPAEMVRTSMSIPLFFEPVKRPLSKWNAAKWAHYTGFRGPAFREATLVDGGLVSNFPIHVFHKKGVPTRPSFGIKLNNSRATAKPIDRLGILGFQSFATARHLFDYDFLYKNPDYRQLIGYIDTGQHHWLNFRMGNEEKLDLFRRGVKAAADFLTHFNWDNYKKIRAITSS